MQEKGKQDNGLGPLGICHRLFNFIMNIILPRGTRHIALGTSNTTSPRDDETRAFEASQTDEDQVIKPDSQELLVEYRHTNGSVVNRTNDTSGRVSVQENRNSTQTRKETGSQNPHKGKGDREKETKKSALTIMEGGNLAGRKKPHLLNVASNINEKADDFIRSRKEAMKQTNDVEW